jgi:RNA polymerase sigma-70 factor, ECF subfamily
MSEPADVDLMLKVKRGDREAFRLLISRYQRPLVNFIYRFTGNPSESEELAQDVFLKIFQAAPRYEPQAEFTTWLYRIATNLTLNHLRDHKPHFITPLDQEPDGEVGGFAEIPDPRPWAEEKFLEKERIRNIRNAVNALPENQKLALILTKYQDLSLKEAAEVLQCSETAIKSLIFRAYSNLREKLAPIVTEMA